MTRHHFSALSAVLTLAGCGGSSPAPQGFSPPAVFVINATAEIPATSAQIILPTLAGDALTATFPSMAAPISVAVQSSDGPTDAGQLSTNIWSPNCFWPLEEVQFVFNGAQQFVAVPALTLSSPRIVGNPAFFYGEFFKGGAVSATSASYGSLIAAQKVFTSPSWPAQSVVLPSLPISWTAVPGDQYVYEIVASTSQSLVCGAPYG